MKMNSLGRRVKALEEAVNLDNGEGRVLFCVGSEEEGYTYSTGTPKGPVPVDAAKVRDNDVIFFFGGLTDEGKPLHNKPPER